MVTPSKNFINHKPQRGCEATVKKKFIREISLAKET